MSFSGFWGVFIPRTLNEKKNPHAPDREQIFGGGGTRWEKDYFLAHRTLRVERLTVAIGRTRYQVTKGNNFAAKTAISCSLGLLALMARGAFIYGLSEASDPL
jgi:hypothetical protein